MVEFLQRKFGKVCEITGPEPSDTYFAFHHLGTKEADAVICAYHDQGLIPVKMVDFDRTVNITLGLPMIRTSVDHGVAYDIAGQNKANPSSMAAAISLAKQLSQRSVV